MNRSWNGSKMVLVPVHLGACWIWSTGLLKLSLPRPHMPKLAHDASEKMAERQKDFSSCLPRAPSQREIRAHQARGCLYDVHTVHR